MVELTPREEMEKLDNARRTLPEQVNKKERLRVFAFIICLLDGHKWYPNVMYRKSEGAPFGRIRYHCKRCKAYKTVEND